MGEVLAGRFELVDILDSGGAGTVWRAWDHQACGYVAAKVLRHTDDDSVIRFVQESRRIIDHPHITAPHNWIAIDDKILFTMDLVGGGSVATLLSDFERLPEGWITVLARQTAAALGAVHAAGLAHRDIKPANLLLDATGTGAPHLRLSDFGTAARFDGPRLTMTTAVVGTAEYLSPEARHGAGPTRAQDIYALGITLHEMATGTLPENTTLTPGHLSPPFAELIGLMTADNPRERPPTAADLCTRLDKLPASTVGITYGADVANPIEIYHQIPPLPAGWTPAGPMRARNRVAPRNPAPPRFVAAPQPDAPRPATRERGNAPQPAAASPVAPADDETNTARPRRRMQLLTAIALAIVGVTLLALAVQLA